jgi:23S rRNA (pseudouridine1915-N3)-methyltransferase
MKITLLLVGATDKDYLKEGMEEYAKRLRHYLPFEIKVITDIKRTVSTPEELQKRKEGESIVNNLGPSAEVVLFDEKGKVFSSREFAGFLQKKMASGLKELTFVVGGAYGFSKEVQNLAHEKISLSRMTFSHQMVRLVIVEQFYRAFTILKGEPYHHE